jgi:hypothetical protein
MNAGKIAQVQSVTTEQAEMKYEILVTMLASAHVPVDESHVAETGLHHVKSVMSVMTQATVARPITPYNIHQ